MFCAAATGPVAKADADAAYFCPTGGGWGWLDPAWTGIYRCDAADSVSGYGQDWAKVYTDSRAGCVDYADVWHNLIDSWHCVPQYSQGIVYIRQDGGWYRGVIRNNNLSYGGWFRGLVSW
jgi:hypothetical protein